MKIDEFNDYCTQITKLVRQQGDLSFESATNALLQKQFVVGVASMFEVELCERVMKFASIATQANEELTSFVSKKAIERQYHTWFSWNGNNANQFFSLFGQGFKQYMKDLLCENPDLNDSIKAFLELGRDRNAIVHGDFLNCSYDKTVAELYELYKKAIIFVELFPEILIDYSSR